LKFIANIIKFATILKFREYKFSKTFIVILTLFFHLKRLISDVFSCLFDSEGVISLLICHPSLVVKFWVAAQDPLYPAEHYSVMVSTTNTNPASFTEVFNETLSDTLYHKITVPLATYNGQSIYIAIRHWNVTDMFYMSLDEFAVDYTTGIKENVESTISVYPNPAFNTLYVSNTKNPIVTIYNNLGEVVLSTNKKAVDVSALSQGLYIVKVIDNNETYTKQINILK